MKEKNVVLTYAAFMTLISTSLGGYVACGAQKYRVNVHGNEEADKTAPPNTAFSGQKTSASANLVGVHSSKGWAGHLPINFKLSSEMPVEMSEHISEAMKIWEDATGQKLFAYAGKEEKKGSSFKQLYEPLDDSINGHYLDWNWARATGKSNSVLATTIWENNPKEASSIVKADIRYNAEFYIFGNSLNEFSQGSRTIVDLQSLALHELGHLIGLTHISDSQDKYSVMNPSLFIGEGMITRRLSEGDIARVRTIYKNGDESLAAHLEKADDFPLKN